MTDQVDHRTADEAGAPAVAVDAAAPRARHRRIRNAIGLGGVAGAAVVFSSGCTLSDVSTVLSILKLLGIGG